MPQPPSVTTAQRRARLVSRHRLGELGRVDDIAAICADLVGFHSTDPATVYLSAAARMANPSIEAVQTALYRDRTIIRHHAMRRTLWVHTIHQAAVAHFATTARYADAERKRMVRLLEEGAGLDDGEAWYERARTSVLAALTAHPGLTTRQLGDLLPELGARIVLARGKSYEGTQAALSRVLLQLGFEGLVTRVEPLGSWNNSQYRWQLTDDWLHGGWAIPEPEEARRELVSWWLRSYGPGSEKDIAWWSGLPLGMVRAALLANKAVEVIFEERSLWMHPDEELDTVVEPSVTLLPGLDPTTMGWKERDWYLDPDTASLVFDGVGNGGPTVWVDGEIVGGWTQDGKGSVRYKLTKDVGKEARGRIEERAHTFETVWGESKFKVRFPVPIQKLLA